MLTSSPSLWWWLALFVFPMTLVGSGPLSSHVVCLETVPVVFVVVVVVLCKIIY